MRSNNPTYLNASLLKNLTTYLHQSTINPIINFLKSIPFQNIGASVATFFYDLIERISGRSRTTYAANMTASIALPETVKKTKTTSTDRIITVLVPVPAKMESLEKKCQATTEPSKLDDLTFKKLSLVEEQIKQHGARRVDLFFYLLVAVHGTQTIISKGATVKQHGTGSKQTGTQACHCSLFPNIKMDDIASLAGLFTLPSLSGTHLEETLNMTTELPNAVNAFDGHLEGRHQQSKYTKDALAILNKAAMNQIDIRQAMDEFLKIMDNFFSDFELKVLNNPKCEAPKSSKLIWECEKAGTFSGANKNTTIISDDYFYLMLRLNSVDKQKVKKNPTLLAGFYKSLQAEIFISKPVIRHRA